MFQGGACTGSRVSLGQDSGAQDERLNRNQWFFLARVLEVIGSFLLTRMLDLRRGCIFPKVLNDFFLTAMPELMREFPFGAQEGTCFLSWVVV